MQSLVVILTSILSLSLMCACAKERRQDVDPEFIEYVRQFEADAAKRGHNIKVLSSITFGDVPSGTDGVLDYGRCWDDGHITIRKDAWDSGDKYFRTHLIYHELGHCTFGYGHYAKSENYTYCNYALGHGWSEHDCPSGHWVTVARPATFMEANLDKAPYYYSNDDDAYLESLKDELFSHAPDAIYR